jgi:BirA family biotin operon repressor/biotin-[acetyl-CoA-carboxylase] ligase
MKIVDIHFPTIHSTNSYAREHVKEFAKDSLVVISADEQLLGRGRYGRYWISPAGQNLLASFVFFIEEGQKDPLSLTHVLAISAIRVLKENGVIARIKWPNDILVNDKKVAGILCETVYEPNYFAVIVGIGLNVNMLAQDLASVGQPATSLFVETQKTHDVRGLLNRLKECFAEDLALFLKEGFTPFLPLFRSLIIPTLRNQHIL